MRKLLTVAEMTLRQLVRRRGVLLLLLLLPLGFYLLRREQVGQSVRSLFLGIGWAVSTAALFATSAWSLRADQAARHAGPTWSCRWAGTRT